jgi:hypothetical protein
MNKKELHLEDLTEKDKEYLYSHIKLNNSQLYSDVENGLKNGMPLGYIIEALEGSSLPDNIKKISIDLLEWKYDQIISHSKQAL